MILAVCLNPAVDVTYRLPGRLVPGHTHRVAEVHARAGGKGINVARVLHRLGRPVTAFAPVGGATGAAIRSELGAAGIPAELVEVTGVNRRTIAVVDPTEATVLSEPGPRLDGLDWAAVLAGFEAMLADVELTVLSGSLPPGVPPDAYRVLTELAAAYGVRTVVDADGEPLRLALPGGPYLVKPNLAELSAVLDGPLRTVEELVAGAERLRAGGAENVVVSRGEQGLLALTEDGCWQVGTDPVAGNPTGAGDALVAGLALGTVRGDPWPDRLRDGAALAAAAVRDPQAGAADPALAAELVAAGRIRLTRWEAAE